MYKILSITTLLCFVILGSGCQSVLSRFHLVEIQQGNVLTNAQTQKVRVGMSQGQVRNLLGDPILSNTFSPSRWDYVYSNQPVLSARVEKRLTLFFRGGILQKIVRKNYRS